jgi:hypothetical protein
MRPSIVLPPPPLEAAPVKKALSYTDTSFLTGFTWLVKGM